VWNGFASLVNPHRAGGAQRDAPRQGTVLVPNGSMDPSNQMDMPQGEGGVTQKELNNLFFLDVMFDPKTRPIFVYIVIILLVGQRYITGWKVGIG